MRSTLEILRRWLLIVLVIGLVGTQAELLLLKHTDGVWQLIPVGLIALSLIAIGWYALVKSTTSLRALQLVMVLFLVSGATGTVQHFRGNVEHERESDPSLSGIDLYKRALMGSTPALAPGTMIQLGLIGLLFTFRHPNLVQKRNEEFPTERTRT